MDVDFEQFKWKNRLLLIFAPDSSHPLFETLQRDLSTRKHEVDDRDLVVFEILGVGTSKRDSSQLDPHTAASLRKRFDISPKAFSLILVGKDGGVKLRRNDPVKLEEIFRLIDSMPMSQEEMRQRVGVFEVSAGERKGMRGSFREAQFEATVNRCLRRGSQG